MRIVKDDAKPIIVEFTKEEAALLFELSAYDVSIAELVAAGDKEMPIFQKFLIDLNRALREEFHFV